ncbi:Ig-like domain-containing protein [Nonomuraea endophytica]|uniref:Ig-like domain-containing protein n=1 Tax=Nonomuraea endophytica TaxID=714136 RepID=UPI0037C7D5F0
MRRIQPLNPTGITGIGAVVAAVVLTPATPTPPDTTIAAPAAGSVWRQGAITFTGGATDDSAIGEVWVAVQDRVSRLWWRPDGTWGAYSRQTATLDGANWRYVWPAAAAGDYGVQVTAKDSEGTPDPTPAWRGFSVDTVAPDAGIDAPPIHDEVYGLRPLTFTGTATDDRGVAEAAVAIKARDSGQWYHPDGTFGDYRQLAAAVARPGALSTTWSFTWTPPRAGKFSLQVVAKDRAGQPDADPPFRRLDVDTTPPDTAITAPAGLDTVLERCRTLRFSGTATDDHGVSGLWVAVQDFHTRAWLRPDGTWGDYQRYTVPVDRPGSPSSTWSYRFTPPGKGRFVVQFGAIDRAGLVDQSKPFHRVEVRRS